MIGINKGPIVDGLETVFSRVKAEPSPKALGRGEIIAVVFQNPLLKPDGVTSNNSQVWVGGGSVQPYLMLPGQESPIIYAEDLKDIYVRLLFPANTENGVVTALSITDPGTGYGVGNTLSFASPSLGGTTASITVDTIGGAGEILTFTIVDGGTGFSDGDIIPALGGAGIDAEFEVTAISDALDETADIVCIIYRRRKGGKQ